MEIKILFTDDAGEVHTLATNRTISEPEAPRSIWQMDQDAEAIRALTVPQAWAVSQTCQQMAFTYLPLDVSTTEAARRAAEFHGLEIGGED
jgi:hypothetical protein